MSEVRVDATVPDFELPATGDENLSLSALRGNSVVLYFYPKANTPGCTQEGKDFAELADAFEQAGAVILGISRDGIKAQENFRNKYGFPFRLLSDKEQTVCNLFGVLKEKNMYGRKVFGIERSTFLIDAQGVLRREWRGVKVKGHAEEVLTAVRDLGD
jgi:peroxiredoxin Q/BCP